MKQKFKHLLNGMLEAVDLTLPTDQEAYLTSLRAPAISLRNSYQSNRINVNYSDMKTQMVYLIRYFPFYSEVINYELTKLLDRGTEFKFLEQKSITVSLFCSGPMPELVSLAKFLTENESTVKDVYAYSFDNSKDEWKNKRVLIKSHILEEYHSNISFHTCGRLFDLTTEISEPNLEIVRKSEIITFQNCLNEIRKSDYPMACKTLVKIWEEMASGSYFILIERSGYEDILKLIELLLGKAQKMEMEILCDGRTKKTYTDNHLKREILQTGVKEFLCHSKDPMDGTILSPKVLYHSLIFRKKQH